MGLFINYESGPPHFSFELSIKILNTKTKNHEKDHFLFPYSFNTSTGIL